MYYLIVGSIDRKFTSGKDSLKVMYEFIGNKHSITLKEFETTNGPIGEKLDSTKIKTCDFLEYFKEDEWFFKEEECLNGKKFSLPSVTLLISPHEIVGDRRKAVVDIGYNNSTDTFLLDLKKILNKMLNEES